MIFDKFVAPLSNVELVSARQQARKVLKLWKMRARYATVIFVLSCASVLPFLSGYPLHAYWGALGKYLVLLSMGLLLPFAVCTGIAISSWFHLRDLMKTTV